MPFAVTLLYRQVLDVNQRVRFCRLSAVLTLSSEVQARVQKEASATARYRNNLWRGSTIDRDEEPDGTEPALAVSPGR